MKINLNADNKTCSNTKTINPAWDELRETVKLHDVCHIWYPQYF